MTALCITSEGLPGIRVCTEQGAHRVTCPDHEMNTGPGECPGCLPREADHGHLCHHCYEYTVNAVASWVPFRTAVTAAEGRLVTPETGGAKPAGYSNLSPVFLTMDECETHLASRNDRTVDAWVETVEGARDAVQFAHAATRAYRTLEIEEREHPVTRQRCPGCDQLTLTGNPTREYRGVTIIECQHCGYQLDEVRPDVNRWFGSPTCEHQTHAECDNLACACPCHHLGARSRPAGVQALWDADQATWNPDIRDARTGWTITDMNTITPTESEAA